MNYWDHRVGSSENPAGDMAESSILISVVVILSVLPGKLVAYSEY